MIKRILKALALSSALALFLTIGAAADSFDLEVSAVHSIGDYSATVGPSGVNYYSSDFHIQGIGVTYVIPKNQPLPDGVALGSLSFYFNSWSNNQYALLYQDDNAYYMEMLQSVPWQVRLFRRFTEPVVTQVIVKFNSEQFLSSDPFAFGTDYRIIPVSDSLKPLPGSYRINITSEYTYNKLIFYSMQEVTDFGSLSAYYDSESTVSEFIDSADKLYYNVAAGEIQLVPDHYGINLEITGIHVYTFKNVPAGEYTLSGAFEWSYDGNSLDSSKFLFPNFVYIDDTVGNAQQAFIDILNQFIDEDLDSDEAFQQLYSLDQVMINTSETISEKIYWICYLDLIQDRILSTEQYRIELAIKALLDQISASVANIGNNSLSMASGINSRLDAILTALSSSGSSNQQILNTVNNINTFITQADPDDQDEVAAIKDKLDEIKEVLQEAPGSGQAGIVQTDIVKKIEDITYPSLDMQQVKADVSNVAGLAENIGDTAKSAFTLPKIGIMLLLTGIAFYVRKILKHGAD